MVIQYPSSLLPTYNEIMSIVNGWTEDIQLVKDTHTFEAGTYGAEDAHIIVEVAEGSSLPQTLKLNDISGHEYDNDLSFWTQQVGSNAPSMMSPQVGFSNENQIIFDLGSILDKTLILQKTGLTNMSLIFH